jgi:hypothetical protein
MKVSNKRHAFVVVPGLEELDIQMEEIQMASWPGGLPGDM